jgi:gliding motility-associated-like protein
VYVLKKPVADAGPDLKIFQGQSVVLNANVSGGSLAINWSPALFMNNPQTLRPVVTPPDDITYTLNVISNNGCGTASDAVFVRVFKSIKIPNAFSPNGDGINDTWKIEALETYPEAELQVFNRQGQPVFNAKGTSAPWDGTYKGKVLPVGVYYYVIDVKNEMEKLRGSVTLLR